MKKILAFSFLYLMFTVSYAQVSENDRKIFADNLNAARKISNLGVNPYSSEYISIVLNSIKYSGIRAVSNELMLKAYPNISYTTLLNLFISMGINETILNQFLYQVCLYNEGNKSEIIKSLKSFCGTEQLANRIYASYWKVHPSELLSDIEKNKIERKQIDSNKSKEKYKSIFDSNSENTEKKGEPENLATESMNSVDSEATFIGDYNRFLVKNLKIPDSAIDIKGTVVVEFIIDTTGKVTNAKIISPILGHGLETEVLRVINLSPLWIPAKKGKMRVPVYRKQPITF